MVFETMGGLFSCKQINSKDFKPFGYWWKIDCYIDYTHYKNKMQWYVTVVMDYLSLIGTSGKGGSLKADIGGSSSSSQK